MWEEHIKDFLQHVFAITEGIQRATQVGDYQPCPQCNITFKDFKEVGKMGCAGCYAAFHAQISQALANIHAGNIHVGKIPQSERFSGLMAMREIEENKLLLQKAVAAEAFEDAAKYRDIINELQLRVDEAQSQSQSQNQSQNQQGEGEGGGGPDV